MNSREKIMEATRQAMQEWREAHAGAEFTDMNARLAYINSRVMELTTEETREAAETGEDATEETETEETTETTDTEEEEEEQNMFTNYTEAVTEDAAQYIRDNYTAEEIAEKLTDREEFAETLNDEMWVADEVTGNGSGSYTFDRAQAREYVLADIDTVLEALREFDTPADTIAEKFLDEDWEYFDVTARCYVLAQVIEDAIDRVVKKEVA